MNEVELKKEIQEKALTVQKMQVKNDIDLRLVTDFVMDIKKKAKQVKEWFAPLKESARQTHKQLCDKENEFLGPLESLERVAKTKMVEYTEEQKRITDIARRKAEAEASAKEEERKRKIQEKIDAEKKAADEATSEEERIRAENKARELEQKKEEVYVAPKEVQAPTEIKGVSTRYFWEPKVVDKALVPDRYKIVDLAMLKKIGTATKGEEVVAGVEWVKQAVQSVRS